MSGKDRLEKGLAVAELVLIIIVIAIFSAVVIPFMRGRTDDANKWSEGKATAISIRTAAENYVKEKNKYYDFSGATLEDLGFRLNLNEGGGDLDGKYFSDDCFSIRFSKDGSYVIAIDAVKSTSGDPPYKPRKMTLDSSGVFTEVQ